MMEKNKFFIPAILALMIFVVFTNITNGQGKPNVVIMLGDNVGYGDIGAYCAGEVRGMPTPRIDQIASEGLRLTQYLVEPACTPSRTALMTGRYSQRVGLSTVIIGIIKWPGKISPRVSNEMVSVHDWFPTLAGIINAKVPTDRPIDGVDQGAFITDKQSKSNRDSLISFIGVEVAAVRWRNYRVYPKQFTHSSGNPAMYGLGGIRQEGNGFPVIFNIEADPREENNVVGTNAWVIGPYLKLVAEYLKSVEKYPNPKPVNLTEFGK